MAHSEDPDCISHQSMWDLWCTNLQVKRVFSEYFSSSLSGSFYHCSILISKYRLLLPERQTGEAWEPSIKKALSEIGEQRIEMYFHFFVFED